MSKVQAIIRDYWLETVAWTATGAYMAWIWTYYSWQAFVINIAAGAFGYIAMFYFGHLTPFYDWFVGRERDHDAHR